MLFLSYVDFKETTKLNNVYYCSFSKISIRNASCSFVEFFSGFEI